MPTNNGWLWVFAIALMLAFAWGLEQVELGPLETGDVYPPYSSLRTDPMGAKALFESLAELAGVTAERLYRERAVLESAGETMFVLGVDPVAWSTVKIKTLEQYEKLAARGGRLVIAFLPVRTPSANLEQRPVEERWDIRLRYRKSDSEEAAGNSLPRETTLYFQTGPQWRMDQGLAERRFGTGTIVLVADSFPLSNEGLRESRDAGFISKLAGPAQRLIFDENHFGVSESGSVTKLMRKYHLEGAVAVLALVALLFLWRSASSFLPQTTMQTSAAVTGRDSMDGLTSLLRRGIAEKDLLDTCYAEWSKSDRRDVRVKEEIEGELRRLGKGNPAEAYRAASRILTEHK